jgi:PAS domain S-box-containing protein
MALPCAAMLRSARSRNRDLKAGLREREALIQAMAESEVRFRNLFQASPDGMIVTRLDDGVILEQNRNMAVMSGYPDDACIGRSVLEDGIGLWARPGDRDRLLAQVMAEGHGFIESEFRRRDGSLGTGILSSVRMELNGLACLLTAVRDVTERKHAEQLILENERILRELFEGSPIGVVHATLDGRLLKVNQALAAMFGADDPASMVEEVNRLGIQSFVMDNPTFHAQRMRRVRERPGTWIVDEVRYQRRDGSPLDAISSLIAYPVPGQGDCTVIGFVQDITERKRGEQEIQGLKTYLANIIDSMPSILVGLDAEGRVTQWNRRAEAVTGLGAGEARGQDLESVLPDFAAWIQSMHAEVHTLHQPASMEKLLLVREGERNYYDLMVYPLAANGVQGSVVRIEDVTERIHLQELMAQAEKMMSVGGLAAGMAHEINNPLGIISQAAQNIARRLSPDPPVNRTVAEEIGLDLALLKTYFDQRQIPQFIASILDAVTRANRIVGNMLQFSRKPDSTRFPASLADIVQEALDLAASDYDLKKKFNYRSIEIQLHLEPALPKVSVVAIELEQVVLNLLKNAAQAMVANPPERHPHIDIRLRKESTHLVLEVEDNGPGMSDSVRRRVFEPFFTTKEPGVGTGLGLSVSYMIITQNHKGILEVASVPGQGAQFTIRLPLDAGIDLSRPGAEAMGGAS